MSKTEQTQYTKISIRKDNFKNAISAHKNFAILKGSDADVFGTIQFQITGYSLTLLTTNGSQGLKSVLTIEDIDGDDTTFNISMKQLSKTPLLKGFSNNVDIVIEQNTVKIIDTDFGTEHQYPKLKVNFPDFNKIKAPTKLHEISLSTQAIKNISKIKTKKPLLFLYPVDKTQNVFIESKNEDIEQTAIICQTNIDTPN